MLPGRPARDLDFLKQGTIVGTQIKRWPSGAQTNAKLVPKKLRIAVKSRGSEIFEGSTVESLAGTNKETPSSFAVCDIVASSSTLHTLQVPQVPFFWHLD